MGTQMREWSFSSAEDLNQVRQKAVESYLQSKRIPLEGEDVLSSKEVAKLKLYYERFILGVAEEFKFPAAISCTALMIFKRFYVRNTVLETHPKTIVATCIYLGTKIEEAHIRAVDLAKTVGVKENSIFLQEVPVLQGIKFHLKFFLPFRALSVMLEDVQKKVKKVSLTTEQLAVLQSKAHETCVQSFLTDVPLCFMPVEIAFAAVCKAARAMDLPQIAEGLWEVLKVQNPLTANVFKTSCDQILRLISEMQEDSAEPKDIDKKLKKWQSQFQDSAAESKRKSRKAGDAVSKKSKNEMTEAQLLGTSEIDASTRASNDDEFAIKGFGSENQPMEID